MGMHTCVHRKKDGVQLLIPTNKTLQKVGRTDPAIEINLVPTPTARRSGKQNPT